MPGHLAERGVKEHVPFELLMSGTPDRPGGHAGRPVVVDQSQETCRVTFNRDHGRRLRRINRTRVRPDLPGPPHNQRSNSRLRRLIGARGLPLHLPMMGAVFARAHVRGTNANKIQVIFLCGQQRRRSVLDAPYMLIADLTQAYDANARRSTPTVSFVWTLELGLPKRSREIPKYSASYENDEILPSPRLRACYTAIFKRPVQNPKSW